MEETLHRCPECKKKGFLNFGDYPKPDCYLCRGTAKVNLDRIIEWITDTIDDLRCDVEMLIK